MNKDAQSAILLAKESTTLAIKFGELKGDRAYMRDRIKKAVCEEVVQLARSGHLPDIDAIVKRMMEQLAELMDQHRDLPALFWSIMLQHKEPDASCPKTREYLGISTLTEPEDPKP